MFTETGLLTLGTTATAFTTAAAFTTNVTHRAWEIMFRVEATRVPTNIDKDSTTCQEGQNTLMSQVVRCTVDLHLGAVLVVPLLPVVSKQGYCTPSLLPRVKEKTNHHQTSISTFLLLWNVAAAQVFVGIVSHLLVEP